MQKRVLETDERLIDIDWFAQRLVNCGVAHLSGKPLAEAIGDWPAPARALAEFIVVELDIAQNDALRCLAHLGLQVAKIKEEGKKEPDSSQEGETVPEPEPARIGGDDPYQTTQV